MKYRMLFSKLISVFVVSCLSGVAGYATALTLDELMDKVRADSSAQAKIATQRESTFRAAKEAQDKLYKDTLAKRNTAENLSNTLNTRIGDNRIRIDEINELLRVNQGNLGELFGVTRQIAGDASGVLTDSLINTQIVLAAGEENRLDFMRRIASSTALPSIIDLERMWFELMGEMKADGEVTRYKSPVLQADGVTSIEEEIVRIGSYGAVANNEYLGYLTGEGTLATISRQPAEKALMTLASDLQNSTQDTGYIRAMVDPARGALLSLYVERPDVIERIQNGEVVGWVIVFVGCIGVLVALFQYVYLFMARSAVASQLKKLNVPIKNNCLGRMLIEVTGDKNRNFINERAEVVELRISEAVLRELPKLERFQSFLRLAVAAGPLLGLIGTVIGMILTFDSITASGSSDPKLMAQGIGQAMIATVLGLGVAIPLLFLNAGLVSLSKGVIHVLEEQSTRLMAHRLGN